MNTDEKMARRTSITADILALGAPGGKFKIISPNQKRILPGDLYAEMCERIVDGIMFEGPGIIATLRPLEPMTQEQIWKEVACLGVSNGGRFEIVRASGKRKGSFDTAVISGDVTLKVVTTSGTLKTPAAILRWKG